MPATEAALLSVVATLLGTVIGICFAGFACGAVVKPILDEATLQIPWLALGVVVLVAAMAGLLASVVPARRATRVTPAAGLSLD